MNEKVKRERVLTVFFVSLLLFLCALAIFYGLCRKSIIEAAYEGQSIGFVNNLIEYQDTKPVEHYLELADVLFYRGLFLGAAFLGFTGLLVRLIFFRKPPRAIWAAVFGTLVILGVYLLNPNNRIYSSHGFIHAGIVYEILNGNIGLHMQLLFIEVSGYSPDLVDYRYRILDKVYDPKTRMDDAELTEFFLTYKNVVIVVRRQELASKFAADRFDLVFNSSNSNFKIYRPGDWATSEKSPAVVR